MSFEPPGLLVVRPRLYSDPLQLLNFDFNADPDPDFHSSADPDPASKIIRTLSLRMRIRNASFYTAAVVTLIL